MTHSTSVDPEINLNLSELSKIVIGVSVGSALVVALFAFAPSGRTMSVKPATCSASLCTESATMAPAPEPALSETTIPAYTAPALNLLPGVAPALVEKLNGKFSEH